MAKAKGSEPRLISTGAAFAIFSGYPAETPTSDIIGQAAVDLIVRRARNGWIIGAVAVALRIVAGYYLVRAIIELWLERGTFILLLNLGAGLASWIVASLLLRARHEPDIDELLATAANDDQRAGIRKLEQFREIVVTEAMPAVEEVPDMPADFIKLPKVTNAIFRSDNGRLLLVQRQVFLFVRSTLRLPVAPVLVWFNEEQHAPLPPVIDPGAQRQRSDNRSLLLQDPTTSSSFTGYGRSCRKRSQAGTGNSGRTDTTRVTRMIRSGTCRSIPVRVDLCAKTPTSPWAVWPTASSPVLRRTARRSTLKQTQSPECWAGVATSNTENTRPSGPLSSNAWNPREDGRPGSTMTSSTCCKTWIEKSSSSRPEPRLPLCPRNTR